MVYKLDKDLEQYFKNIKKATRFSRLFRLPTIGYKCYIKRKGQKDKTYIEFVGCEDDIMVYETQKCSASIWSNFDDLRGEIEIQFEDEVECGMIDYVKIEPCLCHIDPWWKEYDKTWFEHIKSTIKFFFNKIYNHYHNKELLEVYYGKYQVFKNNPLWDLLPHIWIKNWVSKILYIKEKSMLKKEN